MSEDVSATMRVGITVILVAALVATVLNLMVMSNSLLSGGQTTLQSGIDSVSTQEFASYDNTKVSGTQVSTALSLFQGRDVAIVVQTKALATIENSVAACPLGEWNSTAINYGALLTKDGLSSNRDSNMPTFTEYKNSTPDISGLNSPQAKTAYLVAFKEETGTGVALVRKSGNPYYTAQLHNTNGLVDSCYDTIGTTELGNYAYILSSARFSSTLIKDETGSIIGIFFKQLS